MLLPSFLARVDRAEWDQTRSDRDQAVADQSIRIGSKASEINPGDVVKIVGGPFAGGRARVQAVDTDKSQVRVEMKVLGQPAPFTVKLDQVKLAN